MRKIFILIVTLFIVSVSQAQSDIDKAYEMVSNHICECADYQSEKFKNMTAAEVTNLFSTCGLKFYGENKTALNKLGFTMGTDMAANKALWEQTGITAATICPDLFLALNQKKENSTEYVEEEELPYFVGKITEVEKGTFPIFKITDIDGRKHNLLWLTIIDNPLLFEEALKGKKNFILEYYESELYDARIKEYRYMKVLNAVKTL